MEKVKKVKKKTELHDLMAVHVSPEAGGLVWILHADEMGYRAFSIHDGNTLL